MSSTANRHATVAQLREVLATFRDDDCVHTNYAGNLTVIRTIKGSEQDGADDHLGWIELTDADVPHPPAAVWNVFGDEDRR